MKIEISSIVDFLKNVDWKQLELKMYQITGISRVACKLKSTSIPTDFSNCGSCNVLLYPIFYEEYDENPSDDNYYDGIFSFEIYPKECVLVKTRDGLRLGVLVNTTTSYWDDMKKPEDETILSATWNGMEWSYKDMRLT